MKKALAIFLCFSLLIQCVAYVGIIGYYELNKDYIAKTLCENRDKPQKKCCGKCYLKKQLKKVSDNEDSSKDHHTVKIEKSEVVFVVPVPFSLIPSEQSPLNGIYNPLEKHLHPVNILTSIFHPPATSC